MAQAALARMAKFQLEMGGKNPLVVADDADLAVAVECAVQGSFYSTGQRCTASSRLIVTAGIHDRFAAALVERTRALVVGDARAQGTQIEPVVGQSQLDQDPRYLEIARKEPTAGEGRSADWVVRAPSHGTFYRRPAPDQPAYAEPGSEVVRGAVLGLVEVMKCFSPLRFEPPADVLSGRVIEVLARDGQEVRAEQPLVRIELPR